MMNTRIIASVTLAFAISFSILFSMHYISQDPRTMEHTEKHSFFLPETISERKSIFLIGHSHVGQLNTEKINKNISEKFTDVDVYNLAMYHDTPSVRSEQIDEIINLQPKMILYGIAIADFLGPCKYSFDCNLVENNEIKLPDPKKFFDDLEIPKKLSIEQMNPKFTTLKFIREGFSDSTIFSEQGRRLELKNTPFYVIDDTYTRIASNSTLKNSVKVSNVNMIYSDFIEQSDEVKFLKNNIKKFQDNGIKVVLFKTPHHYYYIEKIPTDSRKSFDLLLFEISNEMNVSIYDLFDKYSRLPIWNDLEHISYNEKSLVYTDDVSEIIVKEINQ